jgi:protein O-GlcNAc transferase
MSTAATFENAVQRHRGGQLAEAEQLYSQVLAEDPNHVHAAFLLGAIALQSGRPAPAADLFARATALAPDNPAFHSNLGEAYRRLGRREDAVQAFLRALSLKPDLVEATVNLGLVLQEQGDFAGAIAWLQRAAELKPDLPQIRDWLASAHAQRDAQRGESGESSARPSRLSTLAAEALSVTLESAIASRRRGSLEEAVALCRRALEIDPRHAPAHSSLGVALSELSLVDEAIASFRRALEIQPDYADAHANLGNALAKVGLFDESFECYRRALALDPNRHDIHSGLLFLLPFNPRCDDAAIRKEAREWNRRHAEPLAGAGVRHGNDPSPERRLRVGYVSPDFRGHCQAFFSIPLLSHHDHTQVEVFCYSSVINPDEVTDRIRGLADQWRDMGGMDDAAAAARIREDRVDILVDLTMHMAGGRMRLFARKPAPLQVCWLAYPGTTGLSAMDYRVTDPFLDPPERGTGLYAERSLHLPETFWCYDPLASEPAVGPLRALEQGRITFGRLNNFAKVNPAVIELWARVLREVPHSRLLLLAPRGSSRTRTAEAFARAQVDPARIEFVEYRLRDEYLATYQDIDVCLDTFPSNGHTTSLDALWMGVPVVTLVGHTIVGRAGLCQAKNLGLPELVATTPDEYVRIAADLCADLPRLGGLRKGLRGRMEGSPLMDGRRFANHLESAYRRIWREWCR